MQIKWNEVFEKVFARPKLISEFGDNAVNFSMSKEFSVHFSSTFRQALQVFDARHNYFLSSIFCDHYQAPVFPSQHLANLFHQHLDGDNDGEFFAFDLDLLFKREGFSLDRQQTVSLFQAMKDQSQKPIGREVGVTLIEWLTFMRQVWDRQGLTLFSSSFPTLAESIVEEAIWHLFEPQSLPPCFQPPVQARMRLHGLDRLHFHQGSLNTLIPSLATKNGRNYDFIQTSNITDWFQSIFFFLVLKSIDFKGFHLKSAKQ